MSNFFKKIPAIPVWVSAVFFLTGCTDMTPFAGILYPKRDFSFIAIPENEQPPWGSNARLAAGAAYPQALTIIISSPGPNLFYYNFFSAIFVKKPYKVLHIKEMIYEWDGNTRIQVKNRTYKLLVDYYVTNNEWYWLSVGVNFGKVYFGRVFKRKEPGDEFLFKLKLVYSFEDEPENTQVLNYRVKVTKGFWTSPFR